MLTDVELDRFIERWRNALTHGGWLTAEKDRALLAAVVELRERLSPAVGTCVVENRCEWREDYEGIWNTACDEAFVFDAGTPTENHLRHCCYCGRQLTEIPYKEPEEDDMDDETPESPARDAPDDGHICGGEHRTWSREKCGLCGDGPMGNPEQQVSTPPARDGWRKDGDVDREIAFKQEPAPPDEPVEVATVRAQAEEAGPFVPIAVRTLLTHIDRLREELRQAREERDVLKKAIRESSAGQIVEVMETETAALRARVEALRTLLCAAAPLAWVAHDDVDGARAWEKQVEAALADGKEGT